MRGLRHRLTYRKDEIVQQMERMITNFDSELLCLRHEKIKLEIELKRASFMYVVYWADAIANHRTNLIPSETRAVEPWPCR